MKSIIEKKKLLAIIIILAAATGIIGYYAYGQYRMSQMDKYMAQASQLAPEYNATAKEMVAYAAAGDYDMAIEKADKLGSLMDKILSLQGRAYEYADGPYKEVIGLLIEYNQLARENIELWKEELLCLKAGDYMGAQILEAEMDELTVEKGKIEARKEAIKSRHPEVKEHIENTWKP